ncbi:breast cancer metastasis-suppressor 1-like protein-A isoform X1 [Schistocerca americana]|uniref:breast cancer metastasis-suppressor 1-like protein-A isoform X1 n=1 Tax=Schistocerca americana TaxID=7009 RepID=UPI001F502B37|nr:breast cancer metastasis-suppressor 1-like protein-A isoform X1 [Schistocerca americana]XP_049768557.1 breast cancer metastasis-suppressor 1-like protein-A isoform X1 [Schistocerca cancellata]XP_049795148.1 breast cancer metastasis-suppressor 1-like protein-A isoform X1 [Schistocerca nitens]XP_049943430.1 breast cancer metastasis-suppressor 1-like protein-A isoform X1 [Schistocerca serialis cubense]
MKRVVQGQDKSAKIIKEDREDSDGEEMEHESGETDKSSSTSETSDAATDTDDSSEMDEEECERRRTECMENLVDLERQFSLLREQLYRERVTQVDTKLSEVRSGRAQEYLQPLEQLQQNMRVRTEVAGILRELRLANIQNKFDAEELAAQQNLESEKSLLWDSIQSDLEEKIRRLEEDRNNVDITADLWLVEQSASAGGLTGSGRSGSGSRRHGSSAGADCVGAGGCGNGAGGSGGSGSGSRRKPVSVSGPYVVYMLRDTDILEDWTAIKKALSVSKRKSEFLPNPNSKRQRI